MSSRGSISSPDLLIGNCRAVLPSGVLENACITISKGEIKEIYPGSLPLPDNRTRLLDAGGKFVVPGFIDVHCHGDGTTNFLHDAEKVSRNLLRQGVTTVLPTIGYADMSSAIAGQLRGFQANLGLWSRELFGGFHLEGPYINRKYGAQTNRGVIKHPSRAEYWGILQDFPGLIKWWTCAPELPGAMDFIRTATECGVVVGAGHTEATPELVAAGIRAGLKVAIHWSNATGNPGRPHFAGTRCPGIDEAALVYDELSAEIIPDRDGLHVHPLMARLLFKAKGANRILVITDAGYRRPDDPAELDGPQKDVSIDAEGKLAGSRLTMAGAAKNFKASTNCSWPELARMTALNQAELLGIADQVGSLEAGKKANLVLLDADLTVTDTVLNGRIIPPGM